MVTKNGFKVWQIIVAICFFFSTFVFAQTYEYEPSSVTLYGTLVSAPGETPDGDKLMYPALKLIIPITVEGTPGDDFNSQTEKGITLLQLVLKQKMVKKFKKLKGQRVTVIGTLFHSHTGHHHTDVLFEPTAITRAR